MSPQDEQDFRILEILVKSDVGMTTMSNLQTLLTDVVGVAAWEIINDLARRGLMSNGILSMTSITNDGWGITTAGRNRYLALKKVKKNKLIKSIAFWIILVSSVIAGADVIIKWIKGKQQPSKNVSVPLSNPSQTQRDTNQIQPSGHDTITAHDTIL